MLLVALIGGTMGVATGAPLFVAAMIFAALVLFVGGVGAAIGRWSKAAPRPPASAPPALPALRTVLPPAPAPVTPAPAYRMRFGAPGAQAVDISPFLVNRYELEGSLVGVLPPIGVEPRDWSMRVAVWVREDGTVDPATVKVIRPAPPGSAVIAALRAVERARFEPLLRGGVPLAGWVWFDLTYKP